MYTSTTGNLTDIQYTIFCINFFVFCVCFVFSSIVMSLYNCVQYLHLQVETQHTVLHIPKIFAENSLFPKCLSLYFTDVF